MLYWQCSSVVGHRLAHMELCVLSPAHRELLRKVHVHINKEPLTLCASKARPLSSFVHGTGLCHFLGGSVSSSFLHAPAAIKSGGVATPDGHSVWVKSRFRTAQVSCWNKSRNSHLPQPWGPLVRNLTATWMPCVYHAGSAAVFARLPCKKCCIRAGGVAQW